MWSRLTHHWVRAGLAVLIVGIVLFALGITAYAIHVCASATALIDSAGEIRTMADAEREFAKWRKNSRVEFWIEGDGSGGVITMHEWRVLRSPASTSSNLRKS